MQLDQTLIDWLYALSEAHDQPELFIAAQLVDLAWHRHQASQDLRLRWQTLTGRQQQIALLIYAGKSYRQVAWELGLGQESVRTHARHLYPKLGVASQKELRALMLKTDLLDEYLEDYQTSLRARILADPPEAG